MSKGFVRGANEPCAFYHEEQKITVGSKAAAVQTVAWPKSNDSWATAELPAEGPMPTCHLLARDLHTDMSSAAVEIYTGSVGLSQGMWLSYVSGKLGISFPTLVCIGGHNTAAVAYAKQYS